MLPTQGMRQQTIHKQFRSIRNRLRKKQPWSLHSIYMELISQKTPRLLQDWSIGRAIAWLTKLGIFVLVPGLHQIACKRRILGGLLMVMYFVAEFAVENRPLYLYPVYLFGPPELPEITIHNFESIVAEDKNYNYGLMLGYHKLDRNLSQALLYFSWFLLLIDVRKIENRRVTLNWFLMFACLAGAWFWPAKYTWPSNYFVAQTNVGCPEFCKNDIGLKLSSQNRPGSPSPGDVVLLTHIFYGPKVARILPGSPRQLCDGELPKIQIRNGELRDCKSSSSLDNKHRVDTGKEPFRQLGLNRDIYWIGKSPFVNSNFVKVGNTHKYFVLNDEITDAIGIALFHIYDWTELDPLNIIEFPKH